MTDPNSATDAIKQQMRETGQHIIATLNESDKTACQTINRLVFILGPERALALLEQSMQVETDGGMLTADGRQRRTPGGTFFKLAKEQTTSRERGRIFGPARTPPNKTVKVKRKIEPPTWEEIIALAEELLAYNTPGETNKVKLTLIGRPGKMVEKGGMVLTTMQSSKAPSLPKGLPAPPPEPVTFLVFIALKQWRKVADALDTDPDDRLIVEGYPVYDNRIKGGTMCLYAKMVTTTALQRAKYTRPE
jgi:hypothetical protein